MQNISKSKVIVSSPWEYKMFEVNEGDWVIEVPYSPVSICDTSMCILLTEDEKILAKKSQEWAKDLSSKIRDDHRPFLSRELDLAVARKIYTLSKES